MFPIKKINKVKASNFTVVPLIYIIDEGHGVTFVQSSVLYMWLFVECACE